MAGGSIVNFGSLCIDQVYQVERLTRSGETVAALRHDRFAGGKGLNQSLAAARAGAPVCHAGCIGADGDWLVATLAEGGVDTRLVRVSPDAVSGHAVLQVDRHGENMIVIVAGANRTITDDHIAAVLDRVGPADWLLLQNEINALPRIVAEAAARGIRIAFNAAPAGGEAAGVDLGALSLLIVNEYEAQALSGESDEARALATLRARAPRAWVVLTRGEHGLLTDWGDGMRAMAAPQVRSVDQTGAGDAFIGYLLASLVAGEDRLACLRVASAAGALATLRVGAATAIPRREDVRALASAPW